MPKSKNRKNHKKKVEQRRQRKRAAANRRKKFIREQAKDFQEFVRKRMEEDGHEDGVHMTTADNVHELANYVEERSKNNNQKDEEE